jgi:serine/threonine protein kinase
MTEREIFEAALAISEPAEREAYLDKNCAGDPTLRAHIVGLLEMHEKMGSFLEAADASGVTVDQLKVEASGMAVGPYKLLEQIGEGGMGSVWMAQQTEPIKRLVALKLIKPGMDSRQVIARFEAERQALALMDHPNIAKVLDGGTTNGEPGGVSSGRPYFVMELVKGVPLTKYCDEHRLTPRQRLELFIPVCQAIQHAHQKGIIHRDIKPSNVLVALYDGKPVPKVIDFGVAKAMGQQLTEQTLVTGFGNIVGTLEYMSPEQAEMNQLDIDTRSDIYSLGVLLYELLTGSTPLDRKRLKQAAFAEVLRIIREEEPQKPSTRLSESKDSLPSVSAQRQMEPAKLTKLVRGELDWIVMKALEKDRNRRYETANGFAIDIQRYLADEPVLACPPSAAYRFRKFARRNKATMTMVAMFAVALLIAVAALSVSTVLTSRAYAAEKKAHFQSEANLELTRKAIDESFTKISQSKLLDVPGLQPLRKDLLESAVRFQVSLAEERPDDPTARADLAAAHLRLAILYFEVDRNDDATNSFTSSLDVLEQLRAEHPNDRALYRRVAGFWKAYRPTRGATDLPKDINAAKQNLTRLTRLWEQFVAEDPEVLAFRSDLSGIVALSAALRAATGENARALADFRRQIALGEELVQIRPAEPEYQGALAMAYTSSAWVLGHAGKHAQASEANEKALELRERLVAKHGDVPQYRKDLVDSLLWKSTRLREQGKDKEAELLTQRLAGDLEKLAGEYPQVAAYRENIANGIMAHAGALRDQKKPAEAEKEYRRALDIWEKLAKEYPTNKRYRTELVATCGHLAVLLQSMGQLDEANRFHLRFVEILEKAVADLPDEPNARSHLAQVIRDHAFLVEADAKSRESLLYLALGISEKLTERYRDIPWYASQQSWIRANLSGVLREQPGRQQEAEKHIRAAVALLEKLVSDAPANVELVPHLADRRRALVDLLNVTGQPKEAEKVCQSEVELYEKLTARFPENRGYALALSRARGQMHFQLGKWHDVIADFTRAVEFAEGSATRVERHSLAWECGHLAMRLQGAGQKAHAEYLFRQERDVLKKLTAEFPALPGVGRVEETDYASELAHADRLLAGMMPGDRNPERLTLLQEAADIFSKLAANHPDDSGFLHFQADTHRWIGRVLVEVKRDEDAEKAYRKAVELFAKLPGGKWRPGTHRNLGEEASGFMELTNFLLARNRLDDAAEVCRQAIRLYEKFPQEAAYRDAVARGHHTLAEILAKKKQPQEAIKEYREAINGWEQLAADSQDKPEFRGHVAWTYAQLAGVLNGSKAPDEAAKALTKAVSVFEKLGADYPARGEYRQWQGHQLWQLAAVHSALSQPEEEEKAYRRAADVFEKLASDFPKETFYPQELGYTYYFFLGPLLEKAKRPQEADQAYRKAVAIQEKLVSQTRTADHAWRLRTAYDRLASSLAANGKTQDAVTVHRQAIGFYEKLAAADRNDPTSRDCVARSHYNLAEMFAQNKQPQEAIKEYREAIAGWEKLAADFHDKPEFRGHAAWTYNLLARELIASAQPDEAEKAYRHSIALWAKLVEDSNQELHRSSLAYNSDLLGHLLNQRSKFSQAVPAFRQAMTVWQKLHADSGKDDYRKYQSLSQAWLIETLAAEARQIEKDATLSDGDRRAQAQARRTEAKELVQDGLKRGLQSPESLNNIAWRLATDADPANRDPALAVELAKLAIEREPGNKAIPNTLGVAQYRATDWNAAIKALNKSMEQRNGGDSFDWFFLAMAHWRLGEKEKARNWFDQAAAWMDKHQPQNIELRRFRGEAADLMGIKDEKK